MPRMTNTILLAGSHDPEEILASVPRGVYAARFGGGQVDISNGDFVFSLTESYLIEDGKLTRPLKDVNLIGNGPDVLTRVSMLGTDLEMGSDRRNGHLSPVPQSLSSPRTYARWPGHASGADMVERCQRSASVECPHPVRYHHLPMGGTRRIPPFEQRAPKPRR